MSKTATVATIVVTYNSEKVITACLTSLEASAIPTKIVLVDNGSDDATLDIVRRDFPNVIAVEVSNLGFAGGCNYGVRLAGDEVDTYFFLNPDASVTSTCLGKLLNSLAYDERMAVVSPTILDPGTGQIEYAGAKLDFETLDFEVLSSIDVATKDASGTIETGRPGGAGMLVRGESLEAVGLMDESYFLYWEECEWASRFRRSGLKIGYVPDAVVFHTPHHSAGGAGSKIYEYYWTRNALRLVEDVEGDSKLRTLRRLRPLLTRRLRDLAHLREFALLATAIPFDALGVVDFLRGKSGHRQGLPSSQARNASSE
ncbi:MAG: glycosyltransferase [Acidimicrobiaceae bacterium]|nr:glycosyltransferase [Acidimicrobiaceae bacterium]